MFKELKGENYSMGQPMEFMATCHLRLFRHLSSREVLQFNQIANQETALSHDAESGLINKSTIHDKLRNYTLEKQYFSNI